MAAAFVGSVREKVGQDVPEETILVAMQKLNPRLIGISKVVDAVRQELKRKRRPARRRSPKKIVNPAPAAKGAAPQNPPVAEHKPAAPKTAIDRLEEVLNANWDQAEQEGLKPQRMTGPSFIHAVHRHSDPRDATRPRILRACKQASERDMLVTPTVAADIIRQES